MGGRKVKTITSDLPEGKQVKESGKKTGKKPAGKTTGTNLKGLGINDPASSLTPGVKDLPAGKAGAEVKESVRKADSKKSKKVAEKAVSREKKRRGQPRKTPSRGERYQAVKKKVEEGKLYPLPEAVSLVKETSYTKFDAAVEVHINLGLDSEKADQQVRALVALPHGTGKSVKVLVFASGKVGEAVLSAGADKVGDEELIGKIDKSGKVDFDAVVATPEFMPKLAKLGRVLGPAGLMPSPKTGTVTDEPEKTVEQLKKGRVELRTKDQPIIHAIIGRVSFPEKQLIENFDALIEELKRAKPSGTKGQYIRSVFLTSTMGPSVKVDVEGARSA